MKRRLMRKKIAWVAVIGFFEASLAFANVRLPKLISDNMVLQRDTKIALWGWAEPGEQVTITFHGQHLKSKTDKNGRWSTSAGPFAAGGPYDLVVTGKNQLELHNILVGDVWLASGQSNMEFPLKPGTEEWMTGVNNYAHEAASADFPQIRLFKVHRKFALHPQQDVQEADGWTSVTPTSVANFSAVAYLFGRELHQRYHVPVGLIESSWAGTVAEAWVSEESLRPFLDFQKSIDQLKVIDEKAAIAEYQQYLKRKTDWDRVHGSDDLGRSGGRDLWAAPELNTATWPQVGEPQTNVIDALKGFDGVVWFRKAVYLPAPFAGKDLLLQLPGAYKSDETFFNGMKIGETEAGDKAKEYVVPGKLVKAGSNIIAIRLRGGDGFVGLYGDPDKLDLEAGDQAISLAGTWSYEPATDLSGLPRPSMYSKFSSDPNTATLLFNGMIAPLVPYKIKGVIWYQGESNADDETRSAQYRTLFPALIQDWRKQWRYAFPFLYVQLAGFQPNKDEPAEYSWAELREAQAMALALPATGMATAVDIGDQNDIHPRDKQSVAHRLALAAATVAYGENIVDSGPVFKSMQIEGSQIRVKFSSLGSGLRVHDKYGYARGFSLAAADGKFKWAQARQDGDDIVVSNSAIQQPTAVRYDWSNTPDGNVYNKEGLPALPFRSDAPGTALRQRRE
jgi:sialate O-acetylesterase